MNKEKSLRALSHISKVHGMLYDKQGFEIALFELDAAIAIILGEYSSGPANEREEVTGISTSGKNSNMGNSGFAGGCTRGDVPLMV